MLKSFLKTRDGERGRLGKKGGGGEWRAEGVSIGDLMGQLTLASPVAGLLPCPGQD